MKIRIIGAVAAGTSAAAKARRNSEEAEIIIMRKIPIFPILDAGCPITSAEKWKMEKT